MQCARFATFLLYIFLCFGIWLIFDTVINGGTHEEVVDVIIDENKEISLIDEYKNCTIDTCLNLIPCSLHDNQLTVHVDPLLHIIDKEGKTLNPAPSREFLQLRSIVKNSIYHVDILDDACFVLPGIDTLNMNQYSEDKKSFREILKIFEHTRKRNYLFYNFVGDYPFELKAVAARAVSSKAFFQRVFHVPLPIWDPYSKMISHPLPVGYIFLIIVPITSATHGAKTFLSSVFTCNKCLILDDCEQGGYCDHQGKSYDLEEMLRVSEFTLIDDRVPNHDLLLMQAIRASSIPVIISESIVLPFNEIIDWKRISLSFYHSRLPYVLSMLKATNTERKELMRANLRSVLENYLISFDKIVLTTLKILERRIIPNSMVSDDDREYEPPSKVRKDLRHPFFITRHVPAEGFSAILTTRNAVSLFSHIRLLAKIPSLKCLIVVWTSDTLPPLLSQWPEINRPIHVINKGTNQFQNRFTPYPEICTEAVLSLEDDVSLSVRDIEFMYQVWRENSKRFVSYIHRGANLKARFPSNGLFYHRHYGTAMQELHEELRVFIEKNENCRDVTVDFAIRYITGRNKLNVLLDSYTPCLNCAGGISRSPDTPHHIHYAPCVEAMQALRIFKSVKLIEYDADLIAMSVRNTRSSSRFPL